MYLSKNKKLFCAFIDYRKAFDFVDRCSLWSKLIAVGINGKLLSVIRNLYCKAKSCVKSNGKLSDYFNCKIGVRQGENLSPWLFAIFLNDFEFSVSRKYAGLSELGHDINQILRDDDVEHFLKIYVLLYADDTIVLAESSSELQKTLDAVHQYCENWKLTVDTDKTKIVIFSKCKMQNYPFYSDIKSYKLLMIMFILVSNSTTMDPLIKLLINRFYKVKRNSMPYWIKFISCAYQLISHWNCLISWCCQFCYMDVKYGVLVMSLKLKYCIENI